MARFAAIIASAGSQPDQAFVRSRPIAAETLRTASRPVVAKSMTARHPLERVLLVSSFLKIIRLTCEWNKNEKKQKKTAAATGRAKRINARWRRRQQAPG